MFRRASLILASVALLLAACSRDAENPKAVPMARHGQAIINGYTDTSAAHMAVVYLEMGMSACTGTLIAPRVVLTAGHCLYGKSPNQVRVGFGNSVYAISEWRTVSEIKVHPNYSDQYVTSDIALARLSSAAPTTVVPIPHLPATDPVMIDWPSQRVMFTFVGFGATDTYQNGAGTKRYFSDYLNLVCIDGGGCDGYAMPQTICIDQAPSGICVGDSGGPAFVTRNGKEYVAGVHSYVGQDPYSNRTCVNYGCSTKVDYYDAFITGFINGTTGVGTACTSTGQCSTGYCVDGYCCDQACNLGQCQACSAARGATANGRCTMLGSSSSCNDNNGCTENDRCDGTGRCAGTNKACPPAGPCEYPATCNSATGSCNTPVKMADNTSCNDGNGCTSNDKCSGGVCSGTPVSVCEPPDPCKEPAACVNGSCGVFANKPNGTPCFDGNGCTVNDACRNGVCQGDANLCPAPDDCHVAGVCDPQTGACSGFGLKVNGASCSDGNPCTLQDQCISGVCSGSVMPACPADCTGKGEGAQCDDMDACTFGDRCHNALCQGTAKVCAGGSCQRCNPQNGDCERIVEREGGYCDDNDPCTSGDHCASGACLGSRVDVCCPAPDECHLDGEYDYAAHECVNAPAEDGTKCSIGKCDAGVCEKSMCGCSSSGPATPALFALIAAFALARNRRRASR